MVNKMSSNNNGIPTEPSVINVVTVVSHVMMSL